ncbi:MAG TPA: RES family NAD+ phosphorylase [Candidatus Limnocylindrales bacterium]|nr:RES family NAD+ phosphorylase [Candidatus Limnocylindrales bacterium]
MASITRPDAKLPPPPTSLPRLRDSDIRTLPIGSLCWRVYRAGGDHPNRWNELRHYGPTAAGRFDHQEPPPHDDTARAIVYVARDATAALAEAFQDTRTIDRRRQEPWLVAFELTTDLAALDLTRLWPTRAGASQAIATGRRVTAQAWSRAIYRAYPDVAALVYRSSMAGSSINLALYERAAAGISASPVVHLPLTHPGLALPLARVASKLGYGLR